MCALVLAVGLSLLSGVDSEMHDYCEATDLTITAVGEVTEDVREFALSINSTPGGLVTVPGEGAFVYSEGAPVDLMATAEAGYEFVNWTGDVETIAAVNVAETTITIDGDYSITANFAQEPFEEVMTPVVGEPGFWALVAGFVVAAGGLAIFLVRRRRTTETTRS